MRGIAAAAVFFGLVLTFAAGTLISGDPDTVPDTASDTASDDQKYGQLLEMASGMGLVQARSFYEEAVKLQPAGNWSLILLERLAEDYLFTVEEEGLLKDLLYGTVDDLGSTAAEALTRRPEIYGEFSYRLGLAYWYFYQEAGGKSAAVSWFTQAVHSQEGLDHPAPWLEAARIHADIGGYYEKLGRQDEEGRRRDDFQTYWADLKSLWRLDSFQGEAAAIRRQVASELLSCLIMGAYEIRQSGESREEVERVLEALDELVQDEQIWLDSEQREVAAGQYRDAAAAVERVFADEGGQEIDKKQESAE